MTTSNLTFFFNSFWHWKENLPSSWNPFKLFIQSLNTLTECPPTHPQTQRVFFHIRPFRTKEFIGLSSAIQGLNVVIYKKPSRAQKIKAAAEAILVLSEGFVALKGCGDVLWHSGSCMVLLRALRGHTLHHTLPSKTKTYLSLANTSAALKEIPGWFHASRGLEVTLWHFCCTVKIFFQLLDIEAIVLPKFVFIVPLKKEWIGLVTLHYCLC